MSKPRTRTLCKTQKIPTPFSSLYLSIDYLPGGRIVGGHISDPGKETDSQVAKMIAAISRGLNACLRAVDAETKP